MADYEIKLSEECGGEETIEHDFDTDQEAIDYVAENIQRICDDWCAEGDWGDDGARIVVAWELIDCDGEEIDSDNCTVEIEPNHSDKIAEAAGRCAPDWFCGNDPDDHEWTSEGEGGLRENPGVWSTGGTSMTFSCHCKICGLQRREHSTGSQYNPGDHDKVEYYFDEDNRWTNEHIDNAKSWILDSEGVELVEKPKTYYFEWIDEFGYHFGMDETELIQLGIDLLIAPKTACPCYHEVEEIEA